MPFIDPSSYYIPPLQVATPLINAHFKWLLKFSKNLSKFLDFSKKIKMASLNL
jgi:hypothetical protein